MPKSSGFFFLAQVVITILCPVPGPRTPVFRVIKPSKKKKPLRFLFLSPFKKFLEGSRFQEVFQRFSVDIFRICGIVAVKRNIKKVSKERTVL